MRPRRSRPERVMSGSMTMHRVRLKLTREFRDSGYGFAMGWSGQMSGVKKVATAQVINASTVPS